MLSQAKGNSEMSSITIQLDPVAMREATTQAIIGTLTSEMRAGILEQAIRELLRPSTDSWNRGKSPLDQAFERVVQMIAHEQVTKIIKEDAAIVQRLTTLAREAVEKMVNCNTEKLVERMTDAFLTSLRSGR